MANCCTACTETPASLCPVCGEPGRTVPLETVRSLLKNPLQPTIGDFGICMTPGCDVVYFSPNTVFHQKDIAVPVAWKSRAEPKYVCYCNRVTEDEVIKAIVSGGARNVSDVARLTGAMKNGQCLIHNPKGVCCHKDIENIIHITCDK